MDHCSIVVTMINGPGREQIHFGTKQLRFFGHPTQTDSVERTMPMHIHRITGNLLTKEMNVKVV